MDNHDLFYAKVHVTLKTGFYMGKVKTTDFLAIAAWDLQMRQLMNPMKVCEYSRSRSFNDG